MTDTDIEWRIRIDHTLSEIEKNQAERAKLYAEEIKLTAEARKLRLDPLVSLLATGAGLAAAFTALGGVLVKLLGL